MQPTCEFHDKEIRQRLQDSEHKLGLSMLLDQAKERVIQLESEITKLERRLILASGMEGIEGFRQGWSLHGQLTDMRKRLESSKQGMENRNRDEPKPAQAPTARCWFFWNKVFHEELNSSMGKQENLQWVLSRDEDRLELFMSQVTRKSIEEVIASERRKLASVPSGGGALALSAPAAGLGREMGFFLFWRRHRFNC